MSDLDDIHAAAADLTKPRKHREPIRGWDKHRHSIVAGHHDTTQPSLIEQLRRHAQPGRGEALGRLSVPGSRAPGRVGAINLLAQMTRHATIWLLDLRVAGRRWGDLTRNITLIASVAPTQNPPTQTDIAKTLTSWKRRAEIITGWRRPPLALSAPCPQCGAHGQLLAFPDTVTALCSACGAWWPTERIGILAAHEHAHRDATEAAAHAARTRAPELVGGSA